MEKTSLRNIIIWNALYSKNVTFTDGQKIQVYIEKSKLFVKKTQMKRKISIFWSQFTANLLLFGDKQKFQGKNHPHIASELGL